MNVIQVAIYKINEPLILVRLMGGLGNQMFQYATAKALALKNKVPLKVDTTLLDDKSQPHEIVTHRNLDLDVFQLKLNFASADEIAFFNGKKQKTLPGKLVNKIHLMLNRKHLILEGERKFHPSVLALTPPKCLVGSWQSEKYFSMYEAEIRSDFRFKNSVLKESSGILEKILGQESVCVNVRRGDYLTSPLYSKRLGCLSEDYFFRGMRLMKEKVSKPHFFVFADYDAWAKDTFGHLPNVTIVGAEHTGDRFSNYFQLMSLCKHFIVANSSFSWWGAWLSGNPGKIVIAPKPWFRMQEFENADMLPDSWIKIPPDYLN